MDRQLVRQVAALRHPDRVDVADEIGHRGVGGGQLLRVAGVPANPRQRRLRAELRHQGAASCADGVVGVVVDLAALDDGDLVVEQLDEMADQARLGLTTFAEQDEVVAGEDAALQAREYRRAVADDRVEELLATSQPPQQVGAQLLFDRPVGIGSIPKLTQRRGPAQATTPTCPRGTPASQVLAGRMLGGPAHGVLGGTIRLRRETVATLEGQVRLDLLELHGGLEALEQSAQPADEPRIGQADLLARCAILERETEVHRVQFPAQRVRQALRNLRRDPLVEGGQLLRGVLPRLSGVHLAQLLEDTLHQAREP